MGNCIDVTAGSSTISKRNHKQENLVEITDRDRAILAIKVTRDRVTKLCNCYETAVARELQVARSLVAQGRRERALLVLRRMQVQERAVLNAEASLGRLEEMLVLIETAEVQRDTLTQIKRGTALVKELNDHMDFSSIDDLLLDSEEAAEHARQIEQALQGHITPDIEASAQRALRRLDGDEQSVERNRKETIVERNGGSKAKFGKNSESNLASSSQSGVIELWDSTPYAAGSLLVAGETFERPEAPGKQNGEVRVAHKLRLKTDGLAHGEQSQASENEGESQGSSTGRERISDRHADSTASIPEYKSTEVSTPSELVTEFC